MTFCSRGISSREPGQHTHACCCAGHPSTVARRSTATQRQLVRTGFGDAGDEETRGFRELGPIAIFEDLFADERAACSDSDASGADEIGCGVEIDTAGWGQFLNEATGREWPGYIWGRAHPREKS